MRLLRNSGTDRGLDRLREWLTQGAHVDLVSPSFSLFAFAELKDVLNRVDQCRLLLGEPDKIAPALFGGDADIVFRGRLQGRWLARLATDWIRTRTEIRHALRSPPQSLVFVESKTAPRQAMLGTCSFTTEGLGITPGGRLGLVQVTDSEAEVADFAEWFRANWEDVKADGSAKAHFLDVLSDVAAQRAPSLIYFQMLFQLFKDLRDHLDEEQIIKSATGIRDTIVWKKLFRFQRDGVVGAIDKLERIGGCIIADSVGLGKTFEALAVIKYYELRNDRVLVLCPKRLRDNWALYRANVDLAGEFRSIREINNEIRRLALGAYAPLRYVLPHKQAAYDEKYSTKIRGGQSFFRQVDREESLIHLLRVNILKRMESSVASFALTIKRQLTDVDSLLSKIDSHEEDVEETAIDDIDVDDPAFEALRRRCADRLPRRWADEGCDRALERRDRRLAGGARARCRYPRRVQGFRVQRRYRQDQHGGDPEPERHFRRSQPVRRVR